MLYGKSVNLERFLLLGISGNYKTSEQALVFYLFYINQTHQQVFMAG